MAVWCHNFLTVTGDHKRLEAWQRSTRSRSMPLALKQSLPGEESLEWCLRYWGCAGEISFTAPEIVERILPDADPRDLGLTESVGRLYYRFLSPMLPPVTFFDTLSAEWGDLVFSLRYGQCLDDLAGRVVWRRGQRAQNEELALEHVLSLEDMWY